MKTRDGYLEQFLESVESIEEKIKKFSNEGGQKFDELEMSQRELRDEIMQIKQKGVVSPDGMILTSGARNGKHAFGALVWNEMQKNADLLAKTSKLRMEIKAAGDPLTTTHAGNRMQGGVGVLGESEIGVQGAFQVRPASGVSSLVYSRYTGMEGAAAAQAGEGAAKAAVRPTFTEVTQQAITIAGYTKISRQSLSDSAELKRAVDVTLSRSISTSLDSVLNSGIVTPAFSGLLALATSYTSLVYTSLVDAASEAVATMQEAGFLPSIVAFRPSDWLAVQTALNPVSGDYLAGPYLAPLPDNLRGLRVVLSPTVTAGKVMVIDDSHLELLMVDNMAIEIGYENDDFTNNVATILGEMRVIPTFRASGAVRLITPKA